MRWISAAIAIVAVPCLMAQTASPAPAPVVPAIVVIDAAHGGDDNGAQITDRISEKDVNAQLAAKLRSLLQARGFDARMTRDGDPTPSPTPNQRAGSMNTAHAMACIVLHSTGIGSGVHLYTSTLPETSAAPEATAVTKWKEAQQPFVARSLRLADEMQSAFSRANLPVTKGRSWLQPLDSLQCPAVVVEVSPLAEGGSTRQPNDEGYQQRVAETLAGVLLAWKNSGAAVVKP